MDLASHHDEGGADESESAPLSPLRRLSLIDDEAQAHPTPPLVHRLLLVLLVTKIQLIPAPSSPP